MSANRKKSVTGRWLKGGLSLKIKKIIYSTVLHSLKVL